MEDNKCKKKGCRCLRYQENEDKEDECVHCKHSIGLHEFLIININEHPFGRCNELDCDCQRYKKGISIECVYCSHSEGFHYRWDNQTISTAAPSPTVTTRMTPIPSTGRAGRPKADKITIRHLICFDKVLLNKIPKKGTSSWFHLKNRNLIKENIKISQNTPEELYSKIFNLFSEELRGQRWILYNGSSGQPSRVIEELSFDLIKLHTTKAKRKLYIGPSERDIISSPTNDVFLLSHDFVDAEDAGTFSNMDITNLPHQTSSDPVVDDFFNGYEDDFEYYITT